MSARDGARPADAAERPDAPPRSRPEGEAPGRPARLRPMRPEDLPAVAELERRCFTVPWEEATFRRLLGNGRARAWSAVDGAGEVAGYAVLWETDRGAQLGNLAVRPERRRRGLGRRLVREALRAARASGCRRLFLEVRESNEAALALYRELGFRTLGRRVDYYRSPREDALVMAKETR